MATRPQMHTVEKPVQSPHRERDEDVGQAVRRVRAGGELGTATDVAAVPDADLEDTAGAVGEYLVVGHDPEPVARAAEAGESAPTTYPALPSLPLYGSASIPASAPTPACTTLTTMPPASSMRMSAATCRTVEYDGRCSRRVQRQAQPARVVVARPQRDQSDHRMVEHSLLVEHRDRLVHAAVATGHHEVSTVEARQSPIEIVSAGGLDHLDPAARPQRLGSSFDR